MAANHTTAIKGFLDIQKTKGTGYAYRAALFSFLSYVYDGVEWTKHGATEEQVQNFERLADQYLTECKRKKNPRDPYQDLIGFTGTLNGSIAPKTINVKVVAVKEWLSHNRIELRTGDMKRIRRKMPRVRAITQEVVFTKEILRKILSHMDIRGKAITLFLLSTGCRIGEAICIKERDVDLNVIPARVYIPAEITKTDQPRTVFLSDEAREALKTFLSARDQYIETKHRRARSESAKTGVIKTDLYLFSIGGNSVREIWDRACKKVMIVDSKNERNPLYEKDDKTGYNRARIHGLRKFFRSNMATVMPDGMVEKLMGHEAGLQGVYSRYTDDQIAEFFLKGMESVTINALDPVTKQKIVNLSEENAELRKRLEELEKQSDLTGVLLKRLLESSNPSEIARAITNGR